jgi:hypothetical protein
MVDSGSGSGSGGSGGSGGDNDHILLHEYIRLIEFLNTQIKNIE